MHFNKLFVLASLAVSTYATTTVAQIEKDIATISTGLTALNNTITTFKNTVLLADFMAIHDAIVTLQSTINATTTDLTNLTTPISDLDGKAIYDDIDGLIPTITDSLYVIFDDQEQIDTVSGNPALMEGDLRILDIVIQALLDAFLAVAPSNVVSSVEALKSNINATFAPAIAAYA